MTHQNCGWFMSHSGGAEGAGYSASLLIVRAPNRVPKSFLCSLGMIFCFCIGTRILEETSRKGYVFDKLRCYLLVATFLFISGWCRGLLKGLFRVGVRFHDGFGLVQGLFRVGLLSLEGCFKIWSIEGWFRVYLGLVYCPLRVALRSDLLKVGSGFI